MVVEEGQGNVTEERMRGLLRWFLCMVYLEKEECVGGWAGHVLGHGKGEIFPVCECYGRWEKGEVVVALFDLPVCCRMTNVSRFCVHHDCVFPPLQRTKG